MVGGEAQLARLGIGEGGLGLDAGAREQGRRFRQDAALGQRQDELLVGFARHDSCSSNECPPFGWSFDRMGGLPRGGPRLPDIPQMARKPADFQPYGPACGEPQRD